MGKENVKEVLNFSHRRLSTYATIGFYFFGHDDDNHDDYDN